MTEHEEKFMGEIRLDRKISTVFNSAAIGLRLTLGLILLLSVWTVELLGVRSTIATVLMLIVLLLTLLNILELVGGSTEHGGVSSLVHESLGGFWGFLSGWALLAGCLTLTAIFSRIIEVQIIVLFPSLSKGSPWIGLGVVLLLMLAQMFRFLSGHRLTSAVILIFFLAVLVIFASTLPEFEAQSFQVASSFSTSSLVHAAAWLMMTFTCIEAVLQSRGLIRDSTRRLPPALIWVLLISVFLLIIGQFIFAGLRFAASAEEPISLLESLRIASVFESWIIVAVLLLFFLIAANSCMMLAVRQLYALSQRGILPEIFRSIRSPFRLPPLLFGVLAILAIPLLLLGSLTELVDLAAAFLLLPVLLVNLGAIRSRQAEPNRRRLLVTPFFPLIPSLALAIGGVMLIHVPLKGLFWSGFWLLLGLGFYQFYGRGHLIEAQEGVLVFSPGLGRDKERGTFRILVPVTAGIERRLVLELATTFANQLKGELVALQVVVIPDPLAIEQGQKVVQEQNRLFQWSTRYAAKSSVPIYPVTRLARSVHEGILASAVEEHCDLIVLSWAIGDISQRVRLGRVLDPVIRQAPCDVAILAFHPEIYHGAEAERKKVVDGDGEDVHRMLSINRILVATAGGPHAPLASRLALLLAREHEATISGVYIAGSETSDEEMKLGEAQIQQTLMSMRQQVADLPWAGVYGQAGDEIPFESQVIRADSVLEGILQAGEENDLVLMGASEESMLDQMLFSTLVEDVARAGSKPVLMVKRYRGLPRIWFQRLWDAIMGALPSLAVNDRLEVYKQVRRSSRPDVDFFIMIGLSAIIASYGLLQDSSAVIIGGMLVAPLFSPILAISLSIAMGDIRLLRLAIEATLKGIFLAIGVAIVIAVISPLRTGGHEIAARIAPNLFDLAVALASGAAGSYAISRKDVAAALPGVAIAAALVPPLCVVGIGLATGDMQVAGGGSLLFTTNLVAIVLAGSITLLLLGFRPTEGRERATHFRRGFIVSLALLVIISVPLGFVFSQSVEESQMRNIISKVLMQEVEADPRFEMSDFTFSKQDQMVNIEIQIYAQEPPLPVQVNAWRDRLSQTLGIPVQLDLMSIVMSKIGSSSP